MLLDSEGHIKVTDFGLAKPGLGDDANTRTNSFIGTMEVSPSAYPRECMYTLLIHLEYQDVCFERLHQYAT